MDVLNDAQEILGEVGVHFEANGSELVNPDFVALAQSFGARGYRSESPEQFRELLVQALTETGDGPVLIEVPIERGSEASPFEFMLPNNYGR
jgi:acetolactate synthase-1/2/3 large subunit